MANRILIISPDPGDVGTLRRALGNASDGPSPWKTPRPW
jgi:hypothetical protein